MEELAPFLTQFQSLSLATIDERENPFASYAPFVLLGGNYYIFISDIARHARNLQTNPKAALFFIEDEHKASNIFARKRVVFQCESRKLERDAKKFGEVMELFKGKFDANMLEMLLDMKDFNLYELIPFAGEAVFGFGEAYDVVGESMEQLTPRRSSGSGHQKRG